MSNSSQHLLLWQAKLSFGDMTIYKAFLELRKRYPELEKVQLVFNGRRHEFSHTSSKITLMGDSNRVADKMLLTILLIKARHAIQSKSGWDYREYDHDSYVRTQMDKEVRDWVDRHLEVHFQLVSGKGWCIRSLSNFQ